MYNEIVSKAREIARDGLRLGLVNKERQALMRWNQDKDELNKQIAETNVEILSVDFEVGQINDADPKKEAKTNQYADLKKHLQSDLEALTKALANTQEVIDEIVANIAKIEAGEVKVSAECLNCETTRLLQVITEECAKRGITMPAPDEKKA